MPDKKRVGDLEIEQDLAFQEKEWRVERAGWIVMALLVLAALAGLFGSGPLSKVEVRNGALQVHHDRVLRNHAPTELNLYLTPTQIQDGMVSFWIDRETIDRFQVEQITPEPASTWLLPDRLVYEFETTEADQPLQVRFYLKPKRTGLLRVRIGEDNGGSRLEFGQLILP